jgi:hypothetical protein
MSDKVKMAYDTQPDEPSAVHVEKLTNGYLVRTCGMGKDESTFVKDLSQAPTIMARILGVKGEKNAAELSDMVEEESD